MKWLFQSLCRSVNCMSWVFKLLNIFRRYREASVLVFIWDLTVLLFMESSICAVCILPDFFWSARCTNLVYNYVLRFGSVKIHRHCLYWSYLVLAYMEILFSMICCHFLSHFCSSVNCVSQVSKFHKVFLTWSETETRFKFERF